MVHLGRFYCAYNILFVHKFDISVSRMLKGLLPTVTQCHIWVNSDGATCGAGNDHFSGTHDFTPFGEFMMSPIHYIHYILLKLSVLELCFMD